MAKQEAKRLSEPVIAGMRKAAAKGTKSGNPIGRPGSMPRRKEQSSDFYGAAEASTRRLRPSGSGLPPFSASGLKWALSKARPPREAALSCERVTATRSGWRIHAEERALRAHLQSVTHDRRAPPRCRDEAFRNDARRLRGQWSQISSTIPHADLLGSRNTIIATK
jgi:hypothetical protein